MQKDHLFNAFLLRRFNSRNICQSYDEIGRISVSLSVLTAEGINIRNIQKFCNSCNSKISKKYVLLYKPHI